MTTEQLKRTLKHMRHMVVNFKDSRFYVNRYSIINGPLSPSSLTHMGK